MSEIPCADRQRADETLFSCQLNEAQVRDLASGFVPRVVRAAMVSLLDWLDEDERRARRPGARVARGTR
jgi:hypothetical protein